MVNVFLQTSSPVIERMRETLKNIKSIHFNSLNTWIPSFIIFSMHKTNIRQE